MESPFDFSLLPLLLLPDKGLQKVNYQERFLKVIITGSSGLVGRALSSFLHQMGYEVFSLYRKAASSHPHALFWDPLSKKTDVSQWEGCAAFIHLAGAGIGEKRWSKERKKVLYESRVDHTKALVSLLLSLKQPPQVFLSASAVGFYGDRGDEKLTENSSSGSGFLANLCKEWEESSLLLLSRSIRVIHARFGVILAKEGGMLQKILPLYKWGLGGVLGNGEQYISWITLADLVRAISFCLHFPKVQGAVNLVSPFSVRQKEFANTLSSLLHRPCFPYLPQKLVELVLGKMARELLFFSQNSYPEKLLQAGFSFQDLKLLPAMQELMNLS